MKRSGINWYPVIPTAAAVGLSLTSACADDEDECAADETIVGEWKLRAEHQTDGEIRHYPMQDQVESPITPGEYCDTTYGMRMVTRDDGTATLTIYAEYANCDWWDDLEVDYPGTYTSNGADSFVFDFGTDGWYDGECEHQGRTLECTVPASDFVQLRVWKKC